MKTPFLTLITLSLMLTVPSLHAGLANWISNHLPASWQVSQEYRDEVKYMKRKAEIRTPIIFLNCDASFHAAVHNFNFWSHAPFFSIMFINERSFTEYTTFEGSSLNTKSLAHELQHIRNNDNRHSSFHKIQYSEARADKGAFAMLAKLGYYKALEQQKSIYDNGWLPNERPAGEYYPTCGEYITWIEEALKNCQPINPNDRPDSENLMRNGTIELGNMKN